MWLGVKHALPALLAALHQWHQCICSFQPLLPLSFGRYLRSRWQRCDGSTCTWTSDAECEYAAQSLQLRLRCLCFAAHSQMFGSMTSIVTHWSPKLSLKV